jgi:hypothetical protein
MRKNFSHFLTTAVRHSLYDPQMAESENITLRARAA